MAAASTDLLGAMAAGKDGPLVVFVASISLTTYVYIYICTNVLARKRHHGSVAQDVAISRAAAAVCAPVICQRIWGGVSHVKLQARVCCVCSCRKLLLTIPFA